MKYPKPTKLKKKHINLFKRTESRSAIIKKLDKIISNNVRQRDNWTCQRCHKPYTPPTNGLQCSHFYSRRYLGTRWDMDNLIALCTGCHMRWENEKMNGAEYDRFMHQKLGSLKIHILSMKAQTVTKFSTSELSFMLSMYEKEVLK